MKQENAKLRREMLDRIIDIKKDIGEWQEILAFDPTNGHARKELRFYRTNLRRFQKAVEGLKNE